MNVSNIGPEFGMKFDSDTSLNSFNSYYSQSLVKLPVGMLRICTLKVTNPK